MFEFSIKSWTNDAMMTNLASWQLLLFSDFIGIILWMRPANEGRRYIVTSSLIAWVHTQNDHCFMTSRVYSISPCSRKWIFRRHLLLSSHLEFSFDPVTRQWSGLLFESYLYICLKWVTLSFCSIKAADDDAGNLQPVFLKRLYLLHICIFSFFLFNTSLTTI